MPSEHPIITVTEAARNVVLDMRAAETDGDTLALRIDVIGVSETGREFSYELMFEPLADVRDGDELHESGALPVLIPEASVGDLRGAVLDHTAATGLVIRNPNTPRPAVAHKAIALEGSVEEQVVQLLDGEINPSLAAHGGYAVLEGVKEDVAYITMGGGCQGCGLAALTLSEGIKAQILDRVPAITEVIDVTNHAEGENPFYEASAK